MENITLVRNGTKGMNTISGLVARTATNGITTKLNKKGDSVIHKQIIYQRKRQGMTINGLRSSRDLAS